jgi:hypothetical protein
VHPLPPPHHDAKPRSRVKTPAAGRSQTEQIDQSDDKVNYAAAHNHGSIRIGAMHGLYLQNVFEKAINVLNVTDIYPICSEWFRTPLRVLLG